MLSLFILFVFAFGVAYFATQNTSAASINLANFFVGSIPLYVIVIGSMLLGIFVSWLISVAGTISSSLTIHGKDAKLKEAYRTIESLKKDNNELLLENAHLKGEQNKPLTEKVNNETTQENTTNPSFLSRLKHSFN